MPRLYALVRIDCYDEQNGAKIPDCKISVSASESYVFPAAFPQGVYVQHTSHYYEPYGRTYRVFAEIDHDGAPMQLHYSLTDHEAAAERFLNDPALGNEVLVPSGMTQISDCCVGYLDMEEHRYTWFLVLSVELVDDDQPRSTEIVKDGGA